MRILDINCGDNVEGKWNECGDGGGRVLED
jgi:hypothetical protein